MLIIQNEPRAQNKQELDLMLAKKKVDKLQEEINSLRNEYNLHDIQEQYVFNVSDIIAK